MFLASDDNGQYVEIGLDNEIGIELESHPSTGYHGVHANADGSFHFQVGEAAFIPDPGCMGMDGCGGVDGLVFKAGRTGHGLVSLDDMRDFEAEPADNFRISGGVFQMD